MLEVKWKHLYYMRRYQGASMWIKKQRPRNKIWSLHLAPNSSAGIAVIYSERNWLATPARGFFYRTDLMVENEGKDLLIGRVNEHVIWDWENTIISYFKSKVGLRKIIGSQYLAKTSLLGASSGQLSLLQPEAARSMTFPGKSPLDRLAPTLRGNTVYLMAWIIVYVNHICWASILHYAHSRSWCYKDKLNTASLLRQYPFGELTRK